MNEALEIPLRLIAGWWSFFRANLGHFKPDAELWIPSAVALGISLAVIHHFARKRGLPHPFLAAVSLVLLLPVLFATAFIVPGIILQVKLLLGGP